MPKQAKWDTDYSDLPPAMAEDLLELRESMKHAQPAKEGLVTRLRRLLRRRR